MQKLFIYLHPDLQHADWALTNEAGIIQRTQLQSTLDSIGELALDKQCVVIVPADEILLTRASMPKLSRQRLQQALPYALEEQVVSDITELHFAAGAYQENKWLPTAIVSKDKMHVWLNLLESVGIFPASLIPISLLPSLPPHTWEVLILENQVVVRTDEFDGFTCELANLITLLELKLAETEIKPALIDIRNYVPDVVVPVLGEIECRIKNLPANHLLEDICRWAENPVLNLLQGNFQPKKRAAHNKKTWLYAAYTALGIIGLLFLSNIVSYFILHHQYSLLDGNIKQIYKKHFPNATAVIAPKERMQSKLNMLSSGLQHNTLLLWLGYVSKARLQEPGVQIKQLDYHDNQLILEISASNAEHFDAFTKALTGFGLAVRQQNIIALPGETKGSLIISSGGKS